MTSNEIGHNEIEGLAIKTQFLSKKKKKNSLNFLEGE